MTADESDVHGENQWAEAKALVFRKARMIGHFSPFRPMRPIRSAAETAEVTRKAGQSLGTLHDLHFNHATIRSGKRLVSWR